MNSEIAKRILIFSSVIGCILGVLTIIPFLNFFSFIAVIFLLSPFVLYFCEKFQYIGILNVRQTMLYAYIIGFFGFLVARLSDDDSEEKKYWAYCNKKYPHILIEDYDSVMWKNQVFINLDDLYYVEE